MEKTIKGKCCKCGEMLEVPGHLESFSCLYCGEKLTREQLAPKEPAPVGDSGVMMASVCQQIATCVTKHRGYHEKINKAAYEPAFDRMEAYCRPILVELDTACRVSPGQKQDFLQRTVDTLINELEVNWANMKGKVATHREQDKMFIAIFFVPMVGKQGLSISQEFSQLLQKTWTEKFPKSYFLIGSYDEIISGFRTKLKLCFITTAVCQTRGLADDCAQLTAFRSFRDGYLMSQPEGKALVERYYEIAPAIVTCIDHCGDRTDRYEAIGTQFLDPCYDAIQEGRLAQCQEIYVDMVESLEQTYLKS